MLKNIFYSALILTLFSCNNKENVSNDKTKKDTIYINDYNFIITPDLSNRINPNIHPKPVNDTLIIGEIVNNIEDILDYKRKINQSDTYKFDFINKGVLNKSIIDPNNLLIDFSRFDGKQLELSNYVRNDLENAIFLFKENTKKVYDYSLKNPSGSDVWNYLNETVKISIKKNDLKDITPDDSLEEDPIIIKRKENILILITDGYLENINNSKGYLLNERILNDIRTSFNKSGANDLKEFIISNGDKFLIKNTQNNLKDLNILILELYDRSKNLNGAVKEQPTDFQIMKIIWEKLLLDSGAKKVSIYPTVDKKEEIKPILLNYLEEIK